MNFTYATEKDSKLSYLNYTRFGAILLVILLHVLNPYINAAFLNGSRWCVPLLLLNELGRTGVPLFFMISGFLLLRDERTVDFLPFYRRRLRRIIGPLTVWNVIYAFYYGLTPSECLAGMLNQGCAYHLWFLYQLSGLYLLLPFLKRIVDSCTRKQLWWFLTLIVFPGALRPLFNLTTPFYLFLFEPLVEVYVAYPLLGYLLGSARFDRRKLPAAFLAVATGMCLGTIGNYLWIAAGETTSPPFNSGYALNHFLIAAGVFLLVQRCTFLNRKRVKKVGNFLASLTFSIYFIHVLVMTEYQKSAPPLSAVIGLALTWGATVAGSFLFALLWRIFVGMVQHWLRRT